MMIDLTNEQNLTAKISNGGTITALISNELSDCARTKMKNFTIEVELEFNLIMRVRKKVVAKGGDETW